MKKLSPLDTFTRKNYITPSIIILNTDIEESICLASITEANGSSFTTHETNQIFVVGTKNRLYSSGDDDGTEEDDW